MPCGYADVCLRPLGAGLPDEVPRRVIGWPALAVRVWLASPPESQANALQRAVLRLYRAGVRDRERIREWTGLPPELLTAIADDVASLGWADGGGRLSDEGRAVLDGGHPAGATLRELGWGFVCGLTRQVLPVVVTGDLPPPPGDSEWSAQGGRPVVNPPFLRSNRDHTPPAASALAAAWQRYRRALRLATWEDLTDPDTATLDFPLDADEAPAPRQGTGAPPRGVDAADLPEHGGRLLIEPLGGVVRPVRLLVAVYVPSGPPEEGAEPFLVRHPLGLPGGAWFAARLQQAASRQPTLLEPVRRWASEKMVERSARLSRAGLRIAELDEAGRLRARHAFGEVARLDPALCDALDRLGAALVLADAQSSNVDVALRRYGVCLEEILGQLRERYGDAAPQPGADEARARIRAAAAAVGVAPLPPGLSHLPLHEAESLRVGRPSLRALLVATLLDADVGGARHPLRLALADEPELLRRLDDLRRSRNRVTHGDVRRAARELSERRSELVPRIERTCRALLDGWREAAQADVELAY